jgi:hypothetical protein
LGFLRWQQWNQKLGFWCTILRSSLALIWEKEEHNHSIIPISSSGTSHQQQQQQEPNNMWLCKNMFLTSKFSSSLPKVYILTHHHHCCIKSMLFSPHPTPREYMILWSAFALPLRSCSAPRFLFVCTFCVVRSSAPSHIYLSAQATQPLFVCFGLALAPRQGYCV